MDNYKTWFSKPTSNNVHYQKECMDKCIFKDKEILPKDAYGKAYIDKKKAKFNHGYDNYVNAGGHGAHRLNSYRDWAQKGSRYTSEAPCKWASADYPQFC